MVRTKITTRSHGSWVETLPDVEPVMHAEHFVYRPWYYGKYDLENTDNWRDFLVTPNIRALESKPYRRKHFTLGNKSRTPISTKRQRILQNVAPSCHGSDALRRDSLDGLSTELLLEIMTYLIPIRRIFHLSQASDNTSARHTVTPFCVHQFFAPDEGSPLLSISSYARVSQRIRDVVYAMFYGGNRFILEISTVSITCFVAGQGNIFPCYNDKWSFGSWHRRSYGSTSMLGGQPLSASVLRYVRHLNICVTRLGINATSFGGQGHRGDDSESKELSRRCLDIADAMGLASGRCFVDSVALRYSTAEHQEENLFVSKQLELSAGVFTGGGIDLGLIDVNARMFRGLNGVEISIEQSSL